MGLLGGICGIIAALSGLLFSGLGAAFGMQGAEMIGNLTVAALLFSVWGIVGAVVVRRHGKLGGLFMTAATVGGFISVSAFFVLPGVLLGIAGVMGLVKKNQANVTTRYAVWAPVTVGIFALAFALGMASKPTAGVGTLTPARSTSRERMSPSATWRITCPLLAGRMVFRAN
jgi:hypothetical protein